MIIVRNAKASIAHDSNVDRREEGNGGVGSGTARCNITYDHPKR